MRMDEKVTFVVLGEETYNEETGNYEMTPGTETEYFAYVTDTGTERMSQLYGGVRQYAKTVRVNDVIDGKFDHVLIDGRKYKSDRRKIYRHKTVFEVSGV